MKSFISFSIVCLLTITNFAWGQKWESAPLSLILLGKTYNKASLTYENGQKIYGYVAIPKTCGQKNISFKTEKESDPTDIPSEDLTLITVYNRDSTVYMFERVNYVWKKGNKPKKKEWLYIMAKGYATLYMKIDKYKIDKSGILNFIADQGLPLNFIKKGKEQVAVLVSMTNPYPGASIVVGSNKPFQEYGPIVFAEDQQIVKKIKEKKYTSKDIVEVVNEYNNFMAKE